MSDKPPYVTARLRKDGSFAYYWLVPKRCRPDLRVRHRALGMDREAAFAVARALLAGRVPAPRVHRPTHLSQRFAVLDAASRTRSLTDAESEELERVMGELGMLAE